MCKQRLGKVNIRFENDGVSGAQAHHPDDGLGNSVFVQTRDLLISKSFDTLITFCFAISYL
jgi:hypothetical protein